MAPTIRAGDTVVTLSQPFSTPSVGSVLLVESEGRRLLHRLARYEEGSLWMKGDASVSGDSRPVSSSDVLGTLAVVIPTSHLYRALRATAQFTAELPVSMSISSAGGVSAEQGPKYTFEQMHRVACCQAPMRCGASSSLHARTLLARVLEVMPCAYIQRSLRSCSRQLGVSALLRRHSLERCGSPPDASQ